jgi:guanylate kinase
MRKVSYNKNVEKLSFSTTYQSQLPFDLPARPLLIVISGPSGAGKDAVLTRMKEAGYPLEYIATVTTRTRRANERDNVDYHFVSEEGFQTMIENKELLEWANVYGNWYGVPYKPVKQALEKGQDIIIKVDVQGAATIKKILPQAVFIFLTPSSMDELAMRLKRRHTELPFDLALRIKSAEEEINQLSLFDYIVVNKQDEIDLAVSDIGIIITAEKHRVNPREINLE